MASRRELWNRLFIWLAVLRARQTNQRIYLEWDGKSWNVLDE